MKKLFLIIALLFSFVELRAQASLCTVSGIVYMPDGTTRAAGVAVIVREVMLNGNLYMLGPAYYFTNDTGFVSFTAPRQATAKIKGNIGCLASEATVAIPNAATATLASLSDAACIGSVAAASGFTIEAVDGSPSISATTVKFDETDGFVLTNPASGTARIDFTAGGGASALDDLSDVNITGAVGGNVLMLRSDNVTWVDSTVAGSGDITGVTAGDGLNGGGVSGDVTINFNPKLSGQTIAITSDSAHVKDGSITTTHITNGTITGDDINANSAGSGLVLTPGSPDTYDFAPSELTDITFGNGGAATGSITFNLSAGDPTITFGNGIVNVSSGALQEGGNNAVVSGDAAGGDLSGTYPSPSVSDDSHAHTGSTLSGIDISDNTNLTAGDHLTLTGDDLDVDDDFVLNIGDVITGNLDFNDGTGDSPQVLFTPQTGTVFSIYTENTGDDLQIESNTASTETIDIVNIGAGVIDLTVDGNITAGNFSGTSSGTNTGDQTISLSGDVSGSGTTAITVTIADNAVDGTDIALGSDAQGDVMYYNGTDWVRLAAGTSGHVLHTQGAGLNPIWDTDDGAGGGAPTDATYITQTTNGSLTQEQALGALATGMMASTTTTGVVATRTLTGTAGAITVQNGDGSSDPTFTLPSAITVPTSYSIGSDPADAGVIRLENAAVIGWESAPAGTDITLSVDANEILQASGSFNAVTITENGNNIVAGGDAAGGDLGGTYPSPSVNDDSHAHTGTTISGLDISDDTNLTAGDHITLTGDDLDVDDDFVLNTGDAITGNLNFSDGTGDSPQVNFTPQTATVWNVFAQESDGDLQIQVATGATENVDIINTGAGVTNLTVDGAISASNFSGSSSGTNTGDDDVDDEAIHDNIAGEIAAITDKATPTVNDHLLIEDAADTDNKKDITIGSLETALEGILDLNELQGQIGDAQITDGAIDGGTGGEIADGSITADDLGTNSVGADEIAADALLWNEIGDAGTDAVIALGAHETDFTSTIDAAGEAVITITNTDADAANANSILILTHNDGADADVTYLNMIGDADGSPTNDYIFKQDGFTSLLPVNVPAETYDATAWNGDTGAPQKDGVRDEIEGLPAKTMTLTNKTYDTQGTGNVFGDIIEFDLSPMIWVRQSATGDSGFVGTNSRRWSLKFDDTTDEIYTASFVLPSYASGSTTFELEVQWYSAAATSGSAVFGLAESDVGTSENFDPSLSAITYQQTTTDGTAGDKNVTTITLATPGWAGGESIALYFRRDADGTGGTDSLVGDAIVIGIKGKITVSK